MSNLPHDYYVNLIKSLLKLSSPSDKFRLAEIIEREAIRISENNQAVKESKINLVTKVIMRGAK